MHLADQTEREREARPHAVEPVGDRRDVVRHLDDIIEWNARRLRAFVEQQVGEGRLCAFDLRGKDGLLADVEVYEQAGVGEHHAEAVEATERTIGAVDELPVVVGESQRRVGGQRPRNERAYELAHGRRGHEVSGAGVGLHAASVIQVSFISGQLILANAGSA
jgi:hypothetical protein